jgi:hypothetical protein
MAYIFNWFQFHRLQTAGLPQEQYKVHSSLNPATMGSR